jgi:hypothetical protein
MRLFGYSRTAIVLLIGLALPGVAAAQSSSISGIVTDSSGGVLPGVTVEASSPALIEGTRTATTDGNGRYAIVELRPGTFSISFTLTGFATVKREGIELGAGFSANVNTQLRVGSLEETITVSGATPVVDVQGVVKQSLISKEVIDAIPTGKSWSQLGMLTVGVTSSTADVGGSAGEQQNAMAAHGGAQGDKVVEMDGMRLGLLLGDTSSTGVSSNDASTQEVTVEVGASSAESTGGGVRVNIIPKEGGNTFAGSLFGNFANKSMTNSNLSDELRNAGVRAADRVNRIYDTSFALGGPIMKDKLWFFAAQRAWGYQNLRADAFYEANPADYRYDPDPSRQAYDDQVLRSHNLRLTWQASEKNKIAVFYDYQPRCTCHWTVSATRPGEASPVQDLPLNWYGTVSYSSTLSTRMLFTAGFSNMSTTWTRLPQDDGVPLDPATGRLTSEGYGVNDLATGLIYRAFGAPFNYNFSATRNWRASLNYVTGSHQMKFGATIVEGERIVRNWMTASDTQLLFNNGTPIGIRRYSTPYAQKENLEADLGIFAQDAWTIKRFTLNLGVRFDYMNQSVPAQDAPAGTWVGARSWGAIKAVPSWKDIEPRFGLVYDLFGTGRTALKATANRYVAQSATGFAGLNNPITTSINSSTQNWTDSNNDFIPQANELSGVQSPGPVGSPVATTVYADEVREGWGVRRSNWEYSFGVQHELMPRVGAELTYFRRIQGNFSATDNLATTPGDFQEFCVTTPNDSRLPGAGQPICGLYDVVPTKAGQVNNLVTFNESSKQRSEVWQGVDLNMNARISSRLFAQGGLSTGKTAFSNCLALDNPGQFLNGFLTNASAVNTAPTQYCEWDTPFLTQYKLMAGYTFPLDIQASVAFQSIPGREIQATWAATNAFVRPSLGRDLAGSTTYNVALIEPGTLYGDRINQVDLRFSKILRLAGAKRVRLMADVYNAMNVSPVITVNTAYNANQAANNWMRPTQILVGRFLKVGAQFDF